MRFATAYIIQHLAKVITAYIRRKSFTPSPKLIICLYHGIKLDCGCLRPLSLIPSKINTMQLNLEQMKSICSIFRELVFLISGKDCQDTTLDERDEISIFCDGFSFYVDRDTVTVIATRFNYHSVLNLKCNYSCTVMIRHVLLQVSNMSQIWVNAENNKLKTV